MFSLKSEGTSGNRDSEPAASRVRLAELDVDLATGTVWRDGKRLDLPELSFRLLAALISHAPGGVGKDELIREVWGDVVVGDETLAQRVRLLRQALNEDSQNPRFITSVRGRGYRLICPVESISSARDTGSRRLHWFAAAAVFIAVAILVSPNFDISPGDTPDVLPQALNIVAVLPFQDLSPDQSHGFFADGMQEELLTRLSRLRELSVVSRTSVERYRDSGTSLPQIAADLGADAIIEGSVRIDDRKLRITVQLIDGSSDIHIWAETYDRELSIENVFAIQQEVADNIAQALKLEFTANKTSFELPTNDLDAYNQYLLGRYHTFQQTPENLELAVTYLSKATELDTQFAEAYSALGWAYSFLGTSYGNYAPVEVYPKAREAALRAIAIDSDLANARTLYADILTWYDWDFALAEQEYLRTIEIEPLNVLGYALFLSCLERHDEAIALVEQRIEAQNDDPYVRVNAGWRYLNAGLYEKAIDAARRASQHPDAASLMGLTYLALGEAGKAVEVFEQDIDRQGRYPQQIANLAVAYFKSGSDAKAAAYRSELETLAEQQFVSPALLAAIEFAAGDADRGFDLLQEAVNVRVREVIFLRVNRMLTGYRDDPRYKDLLAAVGL
jgi:TolB-like protein/DNA-binding winged helix-turn-helix (wHTH) protein